MTVGFVEEFKRERGSPGIASRDLCEMITMIGLPARTTWVDRYLSENPEKQYKKKHNKCGTWYEEWGWRDDKTSKVDTKEDSDTEQSTGIVMSSMTRDSSVARVIKLFGGIYGRSGHNGPFMFNSMGRFDTGMGLACDRAVLRNENAVQGIPQSATAEGEP